MPLHAFAQYGRSYTGPTMQQNQQSRTYFNNMTNQRTRDFQQRQLERGTYRSGSYGSRDMQASQQKLEQEANEKLAKLAQEQQQRRQEHPAANPQQAAAQQKDDDKQLNQLAVKNYRTVFLPNQVFTARQAQQLSPSAQQSLHNLDKSLLSDSWWSKQDGAQAINNVKAYNDSIASLTAGILGFSLASPPAMPAPLSMSAFDDMLAKDTFDQAVAARLIQEAALTERLVAGEKLVKAVQEFSAFVGAAAADPALQSDPKKLRKEMQKSLREVRAQMGYYQGRIDASGKIYAVERELNKSTSAYLAKSGR